MDKHIEDINHALSLRDPQLYSLEILAWVADNILLTKDADVDAALQKISGRYSTVTDFERDFPSLCFALATGVGKTRLMGAAIAYLYMAKGMKNFFVLAPNLTIYKKLITDFTAGTSKYVFNGLAEFTAHTPQIITAENYENRGGLSAPEDDIHINIFNISKINSEVRGDKAPRIKRMSEYIGQSYFEKLAGQDDLVLLMDESHRYRASAGINAINELRPVLGIELTATPQVERGQNPIPFKNVIYDYPLYKAMNDEFVKEPAAATRENFDPDNYDEEGLEEKKLQDGIIIHEDTKIALDVYAKNHNKIQVKPFMLVIARDIPHAKSLRARIEQDDFCEGYYQGRVITVDSSQTGAEKDENIDLLLSVEDPENPTEIVIHVNMLKEGWDVTNLYTIVPLRAAHSRTLVEQAIGRGLRLPYGKRTGVDAVDRLTIVAHDHFDQIIRDSQDSKSMFKSHIIKEDHARQAKQPFAIRPMVETNIAQIAASVCEEGEELAEAFLETIAELKDVPPARHLANKNNQQEIIKSIIDKIQGSIDESQVTDAVEKMIPNYIQNTIDIPRITIKTKGEQVFTYTSFVLDKVALGTPEPVSQKILLDYLASVKQGSLHGGRSFLAKGTPKDFIVSALREYGDISYDDHAAIVNDLAEQAVAHISSYSSDEDKVLNVAQFYCKKLAKEINAQMQPHRKVGKVAYTDYEVKGFVRLNTTYASHNANEEQRHFSDKVASPSQIKGMVFCGFKKSLHPVQKFDSDSEREFSVWLEKQPDVIRWGKPARRDLEIFYSEERTYQPDFVVETSVGKLLCEIKREDNIDDDDVQEKADAALKWCAKASEHELYYSGDSWRYLLIPHDQILSNTNLDGLIKQFEVQAD